MEEWLESRVKDEEHLDVAQTHKSGARERVRPIRKRRKAEENSGKG